MGGAQSVEYHDEALPRTMAPNNYLKGDNNILMKETFYYKGAKGRKKLNKNSGLDFAITIILIYLIFYIFTKYKF